MLWYPGGVYLPLLDRDLDVLPSIFDRKSLLRDLDGPLLSIRDRGAQLRDRDLDVLSPIQARNDLLLDRDLEVLLAILDDRDALLRDRVDARLYIRDHDSLLLDRDLDARVSTMDRMALSIKARALVRSLDRDLLRGRCLTVSSVPVLETASLLIKNKIKNIRPVL